MNNKHLIIAILSIIILLLCGGIAYNLFGQQTEYVTVNIIENGTTIEIPKDMTLKSNNSGIVVLENENTIVITFNSINKGIPEIMAFADIKIPIFGNEYSGNVTLKDPTTAGCSLKGECNAVYIGNNETHDNIIVISKNKNIVDHIINSIKWKITEEPHEEVASSVETSPSAYAYKADGTPMYSQDEVSNYMKNKYGLVNYHIEDNGYIDMDEPGYDDAGNKINNSK